MERRLAPTLSSLDPNGRRPARAAAASVGRVSAPSAAPSSPVPRYPPAALLPSFLGPSPEAALRALSRQCQGPGVIPLSALGTTPSAGPGERARPGELLSHLPPRASGYVGALGCCLPCLSLLWALLPNCSHAHPRRPAFPGAAYYGDEQSGDAQCCIMVPGHHCPNGLRCPSGPQCPLTPESPHRAPFSLPSSHLRSPPSHRGAGSLLPASHGAAQPHQGRLLPGPGGSELLQWALPIQHQRHARGEQGGCCAGPGVSGQPAPPRGCCCDPAPGQSPGDLRDLVDLKGVQLRAKGEFSPRRWAAPAAGPCDPSRGLGSQPTPGLHPVLWAQS